MRCPCRSRSGAMRPVWLRLIVAHNHPSGDPTPSAHDRSVTRQLVDAGRLLDIPVYDHLVLGAGALLSFAEPGLL
jgi:DNA repair protein RadC